MALLQEKQLLQRALLREVSRLYHTDKARCQAHRSRAAKISWDAAFAQVMLAQQQSIAELLATVKVRPCACGLCLHSPS